MLKEEEKSFHSVHVAYTMAYVASVSWISLSCNSHRLTFFAMGNAVELESIYAVVGHTNPVIH